MTTYTELDKIVYDIRDLADNLFFDYDTIRFSHMTSEDVKTLYTCACQWLLCTVKKFTDQIGETGNTVERTFNSTLFNDVVFRTKFDGWDAPVFFAQWKSMGLELPFNLVKNIMQGKGYLIKVTEMKHRDNLYAPLTTTFILQIAQNRSRARED